MWQLNFIFKTEIFFSGITFLKLLTVVFVFIALLTAIHPPSPKIVFLHLSYCSNIHQFCCYFKDLPAVELRNGKSAGKRIYNTRNLKHDDVSLVEEVRKTLCALWQGGQSAISPDSLFSVMWKIFPRFR